MPIPLKALLALVGTGAAGGGLGFAAGSFGKKKEVGQVEDLFNSYNQEENKQLENEAFMNGVQFALSGGEGVEKQSFYQERVQGAFNDEFKKIAGPRLNLLKETVKGLGGMAKRDLGPTVQAAKNKLDDTFTRGIRSKINMEKQVAGGIARPGIERDINADAMKNVRNIGIAGVSAAAIGVALKRALKNPSTKEQVLKFMNANKGKIALGGGAAAGAVAANAALN
jgi:hypothetical protein